MAGVLMFKVSAICCHIPRLSWIKLKLYVLHILNLNQLKIKIPSRSEMISNPLDTRVILKLFHTHLSAVTCSYVAEIIIKCLYNTLRIRNQLLVLQQNNLGLPYLVEAVSFSCTTDQLSGDVTLR